MFERFTARFATSEESSDVATLPQDAPRELGLVADLSEFTNYFAVIRFHPDGTIIDANPPFCDAVGYRLEEIAGQHHRIFVHPEYARSPEYRQFWDDLARGKAQVAEFRRFRKSGEEIWIQAAYAPVFDEAGRVVRIVKYAMDITEKKVAANITAAKLEAIRRSQAVVEFQMDGTILTANDHFLTTVGYSLHEIQGKHHRLFVDAAERDSAEYQEFWRSLARGEYAAGQFKRVRKDGREIWLQATYNPILDTDGKPIRVVQFANDITEQVTLKQRATEVGDVLAESTEQMSTTITEISQNVNSTAELASATKGMADATSQAVEQLEENSRMIEKVVDVIRNLAEQTNLLALNATIESARAGEAGRSFAVVASEVKDLANQTADATQNIEQSVTEIKNSIAGAVDSTQSITMSVADVNEKMTMIAAAVEEQSVTMQSLNGTANQLRSM